MTAPVATLVAHLAATPNMAAQLRTLHALALYDSGDAKLGSEEKEALKDTAHLATLLDNVPNEQLRNLLPEG